jgi:hypothetical protein
MAFLDNLAQRERKFYLVSYLVGRTARALDAALRVFSIFQHKRERKSAGKKPPPHTLLRAFIKKHLGKNLKKQQL